MRRKAMSARYQEAAHTCVEIRKLKRSIGFSEESEIDEYIAKIQLRLSTETITLKEEKLGLKEIAELKRRRPQLSRMKSLKELLTTQAGDGGLKRQIASVEEEMIRQQEERRKLKDQFWTLPDRHKKYKSVMTGLLDRRRSLDD